jgi:RimJ/RimL family protein N-acetyltransferase
MEVTLLEVDGSLARALAEDLQACESRYSVHFGEHVELAQQVVEQTLILFEAVPRETPWIGYLGVDKESGVVVGTCGFKSGPQPDGTVEIAYFTFPAFEGRGVATAMAGLLIALARSAPEVRVVIAHTLPERNASTRVLEKAGLNHAGDIVDPENGPVWRWTCNVTT